METVSQDAQECNDKTSKTASKRKGKKRGRPPKVTGSSKPKWATIKESTGKKGGKYFKSGLPSKKESIIYANLSEIDTRPAELIAMETGFSKTTVLRLLRKLESKEAIAQDPLHNFWNEKL